MVKHLPAMRETWVWSLGREKSPGEGNGNPLQYSCLENPMDRGGWRATVHGVAKSQTRLKQLKHVCMYARVPYSPASEAECEGYHEIKPVLGYTLPSDSHSSKDKGCIVWCDSSVCVYIRNDVSIHTCLLVNRPCLAGTWESGYSGCLRGGE